MARPQKQKISTQGEVGGGLFQAFSSLEAAGLPSGPAETPPETGAEVPPPPKMGRVVLRKETAHRGGKSVIVIDDFATSYTNSFIETLAKELRNHCGCGGAIKERTIELQGEQAAKVRLFLEQKGFRVAGIR